MIEVQIIEKQNELEKIIPCCKNAAKAVKSSLLFEYMDIMYLWWETFKHSPETTFGARRGRNFLGLKSTLDKFYLVIAKQEGRVIGAVPLSAFSVTLQRDICLKIITLSPDFVFMPKQVFFFDPSLDHEKIISTLFEKICSLVVDYDLFFLCYIPSDSHQLILIRKILNAYRSKGYVYEERITGRRGGMHPWTVDIIKKNLSNIIATAGEKQLRHIDLCELEAVLNAINPQQLLFPATRKKLETVLKRNLNGLENLDADQKKSFNIIVENLAHAPIKYPYIPLPSTREEYMQQLSGSTRRYFRRYGRRFVEQGGSFEKISAFAINPRDIEDYIRLHMLRFGKDSSASGGTASYFHSALCNLLAREDRLTLFFATIGGKRIAAHSCIDISKRREGYFTGRDPEYEVLRAGRLLYMETILDAIDNGCSVYDCGYGGDNYKESFSKTFVITHNFFVTTDGKISDIEKLFPGFECMLPL